MAEAAWRFSFSAALQGALGWYMVASGLVDRVDVSQYRLAAHLTLAALIFAAIIWVAMGVGRQAPSIRHRPVDWFAVLLVALILLQIAAGGFVAGLDAGQGYATWPMMDGAMDSRRPLDHGAGLEEYLRERDDRAIQPPRSGLCRVDSQPSIHAWRSFTLPAMVSRLCRVSRRPAFGILTLLLHVPLAAALVHQAGAMIVLAPPSGIFTSGLSSDRLIQIRNDVGHILDAD